MFVWVYDDSTHRGFDFCSSVVPSFEFGLLYLYLEIFPYSPFVFHSSRLHSALAGIFLYSARNFSLAFTLYIRSPVHTHTHTSADIVNSYTIEGRIYFEKLIGWSTIITRTMITHTTAEQCSAFLVTTLRQLKRCLAGILRLYWCASIQ